MTRLPLLPPAFYLREDVVQISRELLGKFLVTEIDGVYTAGKIVETEAYRGPDDLACHAYNNRRTSRTEVMFKAGGHAYVYLCYGMHHLFNVVTAPAEYPHAVLIRAIEPTDKVECMLDRREMVALRPQLTAGPGVLSQALSITTALSGVVLYDPASPIRIEDRGGVIPDAQIASGTRIGVQYAGDCAFRPWRFWVAANPYVSK